MNNKTEITKITYDIIFDRKAIQSDKTKAFIQECGELDQFLEEVFAPADAGQSTFNNKTSSDDDNHRTKVKQRLRRQRRVSETSNTDHPSDNQPDSSLKSGALIGDRYEVQSFIGRGGYGSVYKGLDTALKRFVAIKLLRRQLVDPQGTNHRFLKEGQILAKLNHPNIVQIYDVREEDGHYIIIMEYIRGENLESFIKNSGGSANSVGLRPLMIKISEALAEIHREGILHRDIKPSNIMVDTEGNPKLMDFGISKNQVTDVESQATLTAEGCFLGTGDFMAPEQFTNPSRVTSSSDVYSLGCTFYKLLTGQNPIPGTTLLELHRNHLELEPTPIRDLTKEVSPSLGKIIHKMMEKNPVKRYRDGASVREALFRDNKKKIPHAVKLFGGILIAIFGIMIFNAVKSNGGMAFVNVLDVEKEWFPKPRTIAVIPFSDNASPYSFVPTEFTRLLKHHYSFYNTVERGDIFTAMEELRLNQTEFISKEDSLRIGKLVGAHIFVMFELRSLNGKEVIYPKVFDVETLLLLGIAKIPSEVVDTYEDDSKKLKFSLDEIMKGVAEELVYRSYVGLIENDEAHLKHGQLYGASEGMKLRVINRKDKAVGLLEIIMVDKNTAKAKVVSGVDVMKDGMRVEEIK